MYNSPVLSIDVSKSKSFAASFLAYGEPFHKPFSFCHSPSGTSLLLQHLNELEVKTGFKPKVVLEATGNYSKPISSFFEHAGYQVAVLNPIVTHQLKSKCIRKIKTDPIDADRIAQVFYLSNDLRFSSSLPDFVADLRNLCRHYDDLNSVYTELQLRFRSILDLVFPNYDTVFYHVCCKSSLELISSFPSPKAVLSANRDDIIRILKSSKHSLNWIDMKVDILLAAARESLPSNQSQQSNTRVLKDYVRILLTHQDILDDIRDQIIAQAKLSPIFQLLKSISGVGDLTAAIIVGEIGDVRRFNTVKQLVAFAGLDPSVFQSGKFSASNNRISKRGSSYLRKALYQATVAGISKRKNGPVNSVLFEFYSKKLSEGKPPKVAIIAACGKLLRLAYGIWRSGQPFKI